MIRFFGTETCLPRWREIVIELTGKPCTEIIPAPARSNVSFQFDADIDNADRETLMVPWRQETGIPGVTDAQSRPLLWNCCVAYEEHPLGVKTMEKPLSAMEEWMVKSNLQTIADGRDAADLVAELRHNGYLRVAAAVEARSK